MHGQPHIRFIFITYAVIRNANDTLFGDGGGTVAKVPCYKSESRWFDGHVAVITLRNLHFMSTRKAGSPGLELLETVTMEDTTDARQAEATC